MKLWGGRFNKATDELVDLYNASITFDQILAPFDILGSMAHVNMLHHCNLVSDTERDELISGLKQIQAAVRSNDVTWSISDEDIHMNIERMLHNIIGETAGKLHTGRSRNDQVALDLHLYTRHHTLLIHDKLQALTNTLISLAENHLDTLLPGYTHLQRAIPVRFAHHLLAYVWMITRDMQRLEANFNSLNQSPLGAGALAGSGVAIDREFVAKQLLFDGVYANSLDAVSNRDLIIDFLSASSLIMMHLSKLSEEIILWSSQEFNFITLDDAYCTGSSMMPQKKNPDIAELSRGKTGRVYGALFSLLTVLKGLPLAYNKDLQEDKEGLFDTVNTLSMTLAVYTPMLATMQVNQENMLQACVNDFSNATQVAKYLVAKDVPFRQAHEIAGQLVRYCLDNDKLLTDLSLDEFKSHHDAFTDSLFATITPEAVIETHHATGGVAKSRVLEQLQYAKEKLQAHKNWRETKQLIVNLIEKPE